MAEDAEILRPIVAAIAGLVFVHDDVENPMQGILHAPMVLGRLGEAGDGYRRAEQIIDGLPRYHAFDFAG